MYNAISPDQEINHKKKIRPGILSRSQLSLYALMGIMLLAGLVDWPTIWRFGAISGLAMLTLAVVGSVGLLWLTNPTVVKTGWPAMQFFAAFFLWVGLSAFWYTPTQSGIQNLIVIVGFLGVIALAARTSAHAPQHAWRIGRILLWSTGIAVTLYLFGLADNRFGLGITFSVGPRSFPLFALIPIAWFLAEWRYGSRKGLWIAVGLTVLIITALARTALVTAFALFILAQLKSKAKIPWLRLILWSTLILGSLYVLVWYYEPLRSRFFEYDASFVIGETAINVMGRGKMWGATWESFLESPWFGKGAGSSAVAVFAAVPPMMHPHNDYLRILHDYGVVGFALWMSAMWCIFWMIWTTWRRSAKLKSADAQIHLAALLALVAILVTMVTDNTLVYSFAMFPLGILVGCSLGLVKRHTRHKPMSSP
jgi:O-antigen ligase